MVRAPSGAASTRDASIRGRCRSCSGSALVQKLTVRGSTLDRCGACGFVQVREQPSPDELRALYGDGYFERGKYVPTADVRCALAHELSG